MTEELDIISLAVTIGVIAVGVAGWEWKKVLNKKNGEGEIKAAVAALESRVTQLHADHEKLLVSQATEHAEVMRGITNALNNLNISTKELTHYIKWLGERQLGMEPPPPLNSAP